MQIFFYFDSKNIMPSSRNELFTSTIEADISYSSITGLWSGIFL